MESGSTVVNGNTWTATGTHKDAEGKVYKTKTVMIFSSDGRGLTETCEYSADDGKSWLPWYKDTMKKVSK